MENIKGDVLSGLDPVTISVTESVKEGYVKRKKQKS